MVTKSVKRKVAKITTWQQRRDSMKGACLNCHNHTYVDNFYQQFDDLVVLYNDKFAKPAQQLMDDLTKDGVLNPESALRARGAMGLLGALAPRRPARPPWRQHDGARLHALARHV